MFTSDYADPHRTSHLAEGRGAFERITSSPSARSSVLQLHVTLPPLPPSLLHPAAAAAVAAALQGAQETAGGRRCLQAKQTMHQSIKISAPNKPQTSKE